MSPDEDVSWSSTAEVGKDVVLLGLCCEVLATVAKTILCII